MIIQIIPDFWKWKKSTFNECLDLGKLELSQAYNHPDLYLFFKRHELKNKEQKSAAAFGSFSSSGLQWKESTKSFTAQVQYAKGIEENCVYTFYLPHDCKQFKNQKWCGLFSLVGDPKTWQNKCLPGDPNYLVGKLCFCPDWPLLILKIYRLDSNVWNWVSTKSKMEPLYQVVPFPGVDPAVC